MSVVLYTSYDNDGRIVAAGSCSNPEEQVSEVGGYVTGAAHRAEDWYFDPGNSYALTARPAAPGITFSSPTVVADGSSEVQLQNVPVGAKVMFGGQEVTGDGNDIALTTTLVGPNYVTVDAFPAQIWQGNFDGTN